MELAALAFCLVLAVVAASYVAVRSLRVAESLAAELVRDHSDKRLMPQAVEELRREKAQRRSVAPQHVAPVESPKPPPPLYVESEPTPRRH